MTTKILSLSVLSLLMGLSFCSSSDGTSNPNKTDDEFASPTGTLTSANAKAVVDAGIGGTGVDILTDPKEIFGTAADFADCIATDGDLSTIDWKCVFDKTTQCTGKGDTATTDNVDNDFINHDYNAMSVSCTAANPSDDIDFACDGEINISRTSKHIYCADMTCSSNGLDHVFNGCRNSTGYILGRIDGASFVIRLLEINGTCSQVTATIRDSAATKKVTCDITQTDGSCDSAANIQSIANCSIN
jgi:hypothetical protein